jgi:hypothetical protein
MKVPGAGRMQLTVLLLGAVLCRYPNAEPVWCQEEPMNMGAYFHVQVSRSQYQKNNCVFPGCAGLPWEGKVDKRDTG